MIKINKPKLIIFSSMFLFLLFFTTLFISKVQALTMITASLDMGSRGSEVTNLQTFLAQDRSIYPEGLVTGYFGSLTAAAVRNFQTRYGISTVGRVGPQTRTQINNLITSGGFGTGTQGSTIGQAPTIQNVSTSLTTSTGTATTTGNTNNSIRVSWQTDRNTMGKVYYSLTPLALTETSSATAEPVIFGANVISDNTLSTSKSVTINNLYSTSSTQSYYYMIVATDSNGFVSVTWPRTFNSAGVSSQD